MKQSHGWMKWMSALVVSTGATACGVTVSEPIQPSQSAVSPLAPSLLVKDLSASEANDWCTWYVTSRWIKPDGTPGGASGPASAPVIDGFTCPSSQSGAGCVSDGQSPELCLAITSIEQCVQNLQRRPCAAPISELDACVHAMADFRGPDDPASCTDDCAVFRARDNCDATVVQDRKNAPPSMTGEDCDHYPTCRIPVE
jgi:hypothetical protein